MIEDSPAEVVGRRIGAALIDVVALFVLFVVYGIIFGQAQSGSGRVGVNVHGAAATVGWVVIALAYYFLLELLTGQTLGKRLLGVRVVSRAGQPPSALAVAIRTLLRVVDWLPFLYFIGLMSILATRSRAGRLGDLAARTAVVVAAGAGNRPRDHARATASRP